MKEAMRTHKCFVHAITFCSWRPVNTVRRTAAAAENSIVPLTVAADMLHGNARQIQ